MGRQLLPTVVLVLTVMPLWGQMTYEGRLTPNESRAWLYGSLTVFGLLLALVYNLEKITPYIRKLIHKFTQRK